MITNQIANVLIEKMKTQQLAPGDCVVLIYPPSLEFLMIFLGCLKARGIPIPIYPPDPRKLNEDLIIFQVLVKVSCPKVVLTCQLYHYLTQVATVKV